MAALKHRKRRASLLLSGSSGGLDASAARPRLDPNSPIGSPQSEPFFTGSDVEMLWPPSLAAIVQRDAVPPLLEGADVLGYLPRDLLLYVVSFVQDVDDLLSARLVCKAWLAGFSAMPLTLRVARAHSPFNRYLAHLARCFPNARGFSMSHGSGFTNDSLAILARLPSLTSLRLAGAGITHSALNHLGALVQLRELELHGSARLCGGQENLSCLTRLERLSLCWSFQAAPAMLNWETMTALRRLEQVSLAGFATDVNPLLEMLALGPAHNLRALDLSGARTVRDDSLETVAAYLLGLEALSVEGCETVSDAGIAFLVYLRQLRFLNVANCPKVTSAGIAALMAVNPNLKVQTAFC